MVKIIGICGGTASGKTTLAKKLVNDLNAQVSVIALDNYYKSFGGKQGELSDINFDHPNSLDLKLFLTHLHSLKNNKSIRVPVYDYATHSRSTKHLLLQPAQVIIVEGLFLYNIGIPQELFDLKIYIDTPSDIRFIRRLIRDRKERSRTVQSVIDQYLATVRPMHNIYVVPNRNLADVVFYGENYSCEDLADLIKTIKAI